MEYISGESLNTFLHKPVSLDWSIRMHIAHDITVGLAYLHRNKVVHGDLKSLNILLTAAPHYLAKLTDFGLAKLASTSANFSTAKGRSLAWTAPELLDDEKPSYKSDVFSLAQTLCEIATRKRPFEERNASEVAMIKLIATNKFDAPPKETPDELQQAITAGRNEQSNERPTAEQVEQLLAPALSRYQRRP